MEVGRRWVVWLGRGPGVLLLFIQTSSPMLSPILPSPEFVRCLVECICGFSLLSGKALTSSLLLG